jgi:hypothetical protein
MDKVETERSIFIFLVYILSHEASTLGLRARSFS